jgi:transglutaminase-like putative cysteine protease
MTLRAVPHEQVRIGEGASTLMLLFLLFFSVTGSITAADWADGLGVLTWAALGGLVLGFAFAKMRAPGLLAHLTMLVLGMPAVAVLITTLFPEVLTLREKLIVLWERCLVWFRRVSAGGAASDNLIFVIQLAFLMWVIAYIAAWYVYRRHQIWGAILPTGAAILINLFYAAPQSGLYFGLYILSALLLLVRLNLHTLERWWRGAAISYASDISFDFLVYGVVFSLLLVTLVWLLPASAPGPSWLAIFEPLQGPWEKAEDQFNRLFSALRAVARPMPAAYFGTSLTMGGPVNLGQRPILEIRTDYGRYWRAVTYDKYSGIGWINTRLDTLQLSPGDPRLEVRHGWMRAEITQTIKVLTPDQIVLYAAAEPIHFDLPIEIRYGQPLPLDSSISAMDLSSVRARRPLREGTTYTVLSAISLADEDSLRADSISYSPWISTTYLQLPENLPARVRTLAVTITEKNSNPYDKAAAIEQYLRAKIKYNDMISEPPQGRDRVDYLLFDRPEGYCNYYASAMAVMARTLGIPARVASGYLTGDYSDGAFHIVEANAHAWVEVYFPNYGWIEFEPTANRPQIERPKKSEPTPSPEFDPNWEARRRRERDLDMLEDEDLGFGRATPLPWLDLFWADPHNVAIVGGSLATLVAIGVLAVVLATRARRLARLAPAARVYEAMLGRARWLGLREQTYATPLERAHAIGNALPDAQADAVRIAALYTRERFSARTLETDERATLATAWDKVRAEWRRGIAARIVARLVAPPRAVVVRVRGVIQKFIIRNSKFVAGQSHSQSKIPPLMEKNTDNEK